MTKQEIFEKLKAHPVFQVATIDGDQPRVRTVLLYRADENGIIFHTAAIKDLFKQVKKNNKAELCFVCDGLQIRISGTLDIVQDDALKDEIVASPSRAFMKPWLQDQLQDYHTAMQVFNMKHGIATTWTFQTNFAEKEYIEL